MSNALQEKIHEFLESTSRFLNEIRYLGLFSREELISIHKKRRNFEYSMYSTQSKKDVNLQYLSFELNFLELIKVRQSRKGIHKVRYFFEELQYLKSIFRRTLYRYPKDVVMWKSFIDFCIEYNFEVSEALELAIHQNPSQADLYLISSKYHHEIALNPEIAVRILKDGLRLIKNNKNLWLQYFKLELLNSLPDLEILSTHFEKLEKDKQQQQQEEEEEESSPIMEIRNDIFDEETKKRNTLDLDPRERYRHPIQIFTKIIEQEDEIVIPEFGFDFYLKLVSLLTQFPNTELLQSDFLERIQIKYVNDPKCTYRCSQFIFTQSLKKKKDSSFLYLSRQMLEKYFRKLENFKSPQMTSYLSKFIIWILQKFKNNKNNKNEEEEEEEENQEENQEEEEEEKRLCEYLFQVLVTRLYPFANTNNLMTEDLILSILQFLILTRNSDSEKTGASSSQNQIILFSSRGVKLFPNSARLLLQHIKILVRFDNNNNNNNNNNQSSKIRSIIRQYMNNRGFDESMVNTPNEVRNETPGDKDLNTVAKKKKKKSQ